MTRTCTGRQIVGLMQDLVPSREKFLFAVGIRSAKVDEVAEAARRAQAFIFHEHTVRISQIATLTA